MKNTRLFQAPLRIALLLLGATAVVPTKGAVETPAAVPAEETAFTARRERLLEGTLGLPPGGLAKGQLPPPPVADDNVFGTHAGALLRVGMHPAEANRELRTICEQIGTARARGNAVVDGGFTGIELARTYSALRDSPLLEDATKEAIRTVFRTFDFEPNRQSRSENHYLVFWVCRYLMAQAMAEDFFPVYGKHGAELAHADGERLKQFIRYRARQGWGEFDSSGYFFLSFNCILALYDFAEDPELRALANLMANLMLVDMAVDTVSGIYGGARGRVYDPVVLDRGAAHGTPPMKNTNELQYLYFGIADPEPQSGEERLLRLQKINYWDRGNESLFSAFRPLPIVQQIMLGRTQPYTSKERKHLHNMEDVLPLQPLEGSIRKQTLYHPRYLLGSVQKQDAYPATAPGDAASYARHQQVDWSLSIPRGTSTHVFTHHPGVSPRHSYWRGEHRCLCTTTFQHGTAHIALFDISPRQKHPFIHAYFPRAHFDEVVESDGWIFGRSADVFVALYLADGYEWTQAGQWAGVEAVSRGLRKASVLEVGVAEDFGSFEDFRKEIATNRIAFDREAMQLTYDSKRAGQITVGTDGTRRVNGSEVALDFPLFQSPYVFSEWDSGVIDLFYEGEGVRLDFNAVRIETR